MPVSEHGAVAPTFTKGPWEATQNRHLQLFVCRADNHDDEICEVTSGLGSDAKAIAALPDLVEALKSCLVVLGGEALSKAALNGAVSSGLAALAKARGEA